MNTIYSPVRDGKSAEQGRCYRRKSEGKTNHSHEKNIGGIRAGTFLLSLRVETGGKKREGGNEEDSEGERGCFLLSLSSLHPIGKDNAFYCIGTISRKGWRRQLGLFLLLSLRGSRRRRRHRRSNNCLHLLFPPPQRCPSRVRISLPLQGRLLVCADNRLVILRSRGSVSTSPSPLR